MQVYKQKIFSIGGIGGSEKNRVIVLDDALASVVGQAVPMTRCTGAASRRIRVE